MFLARDKTLRKDKPIVDIYDCFLFYPHRLNQEAPSVLCLNSGIQLIALGVLLQQTGQNQYERNAGYDFS